MYHYFHPSKISVVTINPLARASTYFFQGLFDGHPEMVTLPDTVYFYGKEAFDSGDPCGISDELWGRLEVASRTVVGLEEVPADKTCFERAFQAYLKDNGASDRSIFLALHYAYARARGMDMSRIRGINYHCHSYLHMLHVMADFQDARNIFLIRDPRASFASIKKRADLDPLFYHFHYLQVYRGVYKPLRLLGEGARLLVRHEDMHLHFEDVMEKVTRHLGIADHPCLRHSSYFGEYYTGSFLASRSTQGLYLSRPDPRYVKDDWKKLLSAFELHLVQATAKSLMAENGYEAVPVSDANRRVASFDSSCLFERKSFFARWPWIFQRALKFAVLLNFLRGCVILRHGIRTYLSIRRWRKLLRHRRPNGGGPSVCGKVET